MARTERPSLLSTGYDFTLGVNGETIQGHLYVDPETQEFYGVDDAHNCAGHGRYFASVERQLILFALDRQQLSRQENNHRG